MAPGLRRRARDRLAIERLDGVHIDHARRDALRFQRLGGEDRLRHQQAVGDDGDVRAVDHLDRLADLELLVAVVDRQRLRRPVRMKTGPTCAAAARTSAFVEASSAGAITTKSDQRTGQRDLFHAHLRRAVFADRDAAVRPHHFHVQVRIRRRRRAAARSPCS